MSQPDSEATVMHEGLSAVGGVLAGLGLGLVVLAGFAWLTARAARREQVRQRIAARTRRDEIRRHRAALRN